MADSRHLAGSLSPVLSDSDPLSEGDLGEEGEVGTQSQQEEERQGEPSQVEEEEEGEEEDGGQEGGEGEAGEDEEVDAVSSRLHDTFTTLLQQFREEQVAMDDFLQELEAIESEFLKDSAKQHVELNELRRQKADTELALANSQQQLLQVRGVCCY